MTANLNRSVDVILSIDNNPLGGQLGATLTRQAQMITITNKIDSDWAESLAGTKSWGISCNGVYVTSDTALLLLEQAFMNNKPVDVSIVVGGKTLKGKALLTDFPLSAVYNKEFQYSLRLLGTGALEQDVH